MPGSLVLASPTGAELVTVAPLAPAFGQISLSQARDASGYAKVVPTTGQTYATPNNISVIQATPAGGISAWTVTTPLAPVDGQRLRLYTTQTVTTFNLAAASGQTVNSNPNGSFTANTAFEWLYSAANATWDRIL